MPKFIGRKIAGSRKLETAPQGALVKLSYSQAVKLPASDVYYELDTSDRGSRGSLAKRWHRWYATVEAIEACESSTARMLAAARSRRTTRLTTLIEGLRRVAQHVADQQTVAMRPARTLGRCLRDAACAAHLDAIGVMDLAIASEANAPYSERLAVRAVVGDALEQAGADRTVANVIGAVGAAVRRAGPHPLTVRDVGWRS